MTSRARLFYEEGLNDDVKIYTNTYKDKYSLYGEIITYYNPIANAINTMAGLIYGKKKLVLNTTSDDVSLIEDVFEDNKMSRFKLEITRDLLLDKQVLIEVRKSEEYTNQIEYILHEVSEENIKLKKNKIVYLKLEGETEIFNTSSLEFEKVKVSKTYYDLPEYQGVKEQIGDGAETFLPLDFGFIPFVYMKTETYNITGMLNKVDLINQYKYWQKKGYYFHGNPPLVKSGPGKWEKVTNGGEDTFKGVKLIDLKNKEANLKFLELNGTVSGQISNSVKDLREEILTEYPEVSISEILNSENISEGTLEFKLSEIKEKVRFLRDEVSEAFESLINMTLKLKGKESITCSIDFGKTFEESISFVIDVLGKLKDNNWISNETAQEVVAEKTNYIRNLETEREKIAKEKEEELKQADELWRTT